jgi:hypothetical protein
MRPLKVYAFGAMVFAIVATVVSAQFASFLNAVMDVYLLAYVPLVLAILISGNAHNPSEVGFYVGFFLEWFVVGLVVALALWAINQKRRRHVAS